MATRSEDAVLKVQEALALHEIGFRRVNVAACSCGRWAHAGVAKECHARFRDHLARVAVEAIESDRASLASVGRTEPGDWFRKTPESLAMLERERKALAESEDAYAAGRTEPEGAGLTVTLTGEGAGFVTGTTMTSAAPAPEAGGEVSKGHGRRKP